MAKNLKRICVNCASSPGANPEYAEISRDLGRLLVQRGISMVYGGSNVGLMGEIANTVLSNGGEVIGIITHELNDKVGHKGLRKLHVVSTMHERKNMMFQLSDGFIAMPGGFGTLEEVMEMLTWAQLGLHSKPIGFLNIRGYFDHLLDFFDHAVDQRFLRLEHRQMLMIGKNPGNLLETMETYVPSSVEKWID